MATYYTIPFGQCFLKGLASWIFEQSEQDPFKMASSYVFLPTQRGVIGLYDIFQKMSRAGKNFMTPKLLALSDLDQKNPLLVPEIETLPKTISSLQLLQFLTHHLAKKNHPIEALNIAKSLLELYEECMTSHVSLKKLYDLSFENAPSHLQNASSHLKLITEVLPEYLKNKNVISSAEKRDRSLLLVGEYINNNPPSFPFIVAGTTGTVPATRKLLRSIATLKEGVIIFPGLDIQDSPLRVLSMISHPQYTLYECLKDLSIHPHEIKELKFPHLLNKERQNLLKQVFSKPFQDTFQEHLYKDTPTLIECHSLEEESRIISLIVREKLFTTDEDITIVTPHLPLTKRIISELSQSQIPVNTSSGTPFKQTPVGTFLKLLLEFIKTPNTQTFLNFAKHPLCQKNDRQAHLQWLRRFEIDLRKQDKSWNSDEHSFINTLKDILLAKQNINLFYDFIKFLFEKAYLLSGECLYEKEDGEALKEFYEQLQHSLNQDFHHSFSFHSNFEEALFYLFDYADPVYKKENLGARVRILGTLEARLNTSEIVILAGLNEGVWPGNVDINPWLSEPLRQEIGLPPSRRRQALAAHDFCTNFYASSLFITRSKREGDEASLESRLWTRIKTVLYPKQNEIQLNHSYYHTLIPYVFTLPHEDCKPLLKPKPCPPLSARPLKFSASQIQTLMQNPYEYYAKVILKLMPLPSLGESLSHIQKGKIIHKCLEIFLKTHDPFHEDAYLNLLNLSKPYFNTENMKETFWWHRFKRISEWWLNMLRKRPYINEYLLEKRGEINLHTGIENLTLQSIADRIDLSHEGTFIVDYKTGTLPTRKAISSGLYPQLWVEAIIGYHQGFLKTLPLPYQLEYWRLSGGETAGDVLSWSVDEEQLKKVEDSLITLLSYYLIEENAYTLERAERSMIFNTFKALERYEEWS